MYKDNLQVIVTAITFGSATIPDPGPYTATFSATSQKVKADGDFVLLEGDTTDLINATPQTPSSPNPIDTPISFKIKVTFAGQIQVTAS
jgi:hypothetical protein